MAVNIFKKASAYRKAHKGVSFQDAIQAVSGKAKPVSGVKKVKVSGTKKKKVVKAKSPKVKVTVGRVAKPAILRAELRGMKILNEIDRLENKRKNVQGKDKKDLLALVINKEHDKLDALKRTLKRK